MNSSTSAAPPLVHRKVFVAGPFPPPIHGFAVATETMATLMEERNYAVERIDLAPKKDASAAMDILGIRLRQLARLAWAGKYERTLYLALSGGLRQAIDLFFVLIARLRDFSIVVHHHSFAYLDRPTALTRILFWATGNRARHLVLCESMASRLKAQYSHVKEVSVLSNAGLQRTSNPFRQRTQLEHVGYFSALTVEKGALQFIEVCRQLAIRYPEMRFTMAGPCDDERILGTLDEATRACPRLAYVGPVYGAKKTELLDSIDVLLFPTSYRNEAEPIAVLEAMSSGVPVIAWSRGCLASMLIDPNDTPGRAIACDREYAPDAVQSIAHWVADPDQLRRASTAARSAYDRLHNQGLAVLDSLFPARNSPAPVPHGS